MHSVTGGKNGQTDRQTHRHYDAVKSWSLCSTIG